MIKDIQYKGHAASPSDYECSDGELAMSLNMIHEDGSLKPVMQPSDVMQLYNAAVKCVHETSAYINYIVVTDANDLGWRMKASGTYSHIHAFSSIEIYDVIPVGNTLVVSTSDGIYYFLWKNNSYISLGNELPELNVTPYISTNLMNTNSFALNFGIDNLAETNIVISGDGYISKDICKKLYNKEIPMYSLYGTVKQNVYERVFAIINHYTTILKRRGFFTDPFYVRFAYRMFDGSHVRHTVPVLLAPTTLGKPLMGVHINDDGTAVSNPVYSVSELSAKVVVPLDMENWYDIITDIDVFVSEPLVDYTDDAESLISLSPLSYIDDVDNKPKCMAYLYGQYKWKNLSEMINALSDTQYCFIPGSDFSFSDGVCKVYTPLYDKYNGSYLAFDTSAYKMSKTLYNISGQEVAQAVTLKNIPDSENYTIFKIDHNFKNVLIFKLEDSSLTVDIKSFIIYLGSAIDANHFIDTKRTDGMNYNKVLTSCNAFYNISEISVREINNTYNAPIPINEGVLLNLTTRQTLSDLGQRHNKPISKQTFSYNSRLNVILEKEQIKNACTSLKMQNPSIMTDGSYEEVLKACVEIHENGQKVYVEIPIGATSFYMKDLLSFAFPHNNAKNLHLYNFKSNSGYCMRTISLKQHEFLNMSYAFNMFAPLDSGHSKEITAGDFTIPSNDTIEYGNIIRLSDVNNPFRFSEEYTVSLPVKEVYALSTAAKALSQGQFGQYPLYAFTSDGIWALELTSTGTYSARQPISRDVVINRDSITQIDNSVLFATDRGIMLISGSQVMCISDRINAADQFTMTGLPKSDILTKMFDDTLEVADIDLMPFSGFVAGCRMIYDYTHQHIIVYNPAVRYAYVYSLKSQLWGMMTCDIKDNVSSYPESLAMTCDNRLVDFSVSRSGKVSTMTVTRPISMEQPDMYKTINTVIQRGCMKDNRIKQVLYGSNDLNRWFMVWNSDNRHMGGFSGTPWKHYRIVTIREFDKDESLYGFSLQYEPRMTNRLR